MDLAQVTEEFFWSQIVVQAMPTANEARMNKLKERFATECKQYVALYLAETLNKPTKHIYHGSSEQLFAEVVEKVRAIRNEL